MGVGSVRTGGERRGREWATKVNPHVPDAFRASTSAKVSPEVDLIGATLRRKSAIPSLSFSKSPRGCW